MSVVHVLEPGPTGGPGAMGARLVVSILRDAGHEVHHGALSHDGAQLSLPTTGRRPDALFVSCLSPRQWLHLRTLLERAGVAPLAADRGPRDPLVAIGGQSMLSPEPIAPFADVLALGDGEATAPHLADLAGRLGRRGTMDEVAGVPGFYVPTMQAPPTPFVRAETGLIGVRTVRPGQRGYISVEVARGCRSKCAFCPIGWAGGSYREAPREAIEDVIRAHPGQRLNLYAPDYSSVSWSVEADEALERHGCKHAGKDARMDATERALLAGGTFRSYSFGVEGLSERLRRAVAKPLPHGRIVDVMRSLEGRATQGVKLYLIFGLPGETDDDRAEFDALLTDLARVYRGRLELTMTHFQAVPHTPLQWAPNPFDEQGRAWVMGVRERLRTRKFDARRSWMCSMPKQRELHEHDAWLQRSGREAHAYLTGATETSVTSGRWRRVAAGLGLAGPDVVLGGAEPGAPLPWSHVDVGMPHGRVEAAWRGYWRALGRAGDPPLEEGGREFNSSRGAIGTPGILERS